MARRKRNRTKVGKKKKPFSGKKKKQQLQEKRQRKKEREGGDGGIDVQARREQRKALRKENNLGRRNQNQNNLKTAFRKESTQEVQQRIKQSRQPLKRVYTENEKFKSETTFYTENIDIPIRPEWNRDMPKHIVDQNEKEMFKIYMDKIHEKYDYDRLNFFEQNLEVWRQLWRTCEKSDIVLFLADIRHPLFHFPPSLYRYITETLGKPLVLVLTKADLVPEENIGLWEEFFNENYPEIKVAPVRSFVQQAKVEIGGKQKKRRIGKNKYKPWGIRKLLELVQSFEVEKGGSVVHFIDEIDIDKMEEEQLEGEKHSDESSESLDELLQNLKNIGQKHVDANGSKEEEEESEESEEESEESSESESNEDSQETSEELGLEAKEESEDEVIYEHPSGPSKTYVTLGLVGHPNVGKSTLINALVGKRVCSTSKSPGHTKHFQTIFLSESLVLCDCPGLVFPAVDMPRQLQILCGLYPIAQAREPYSSVQFIAERIPLEEVYKLEKLDPGCPWSAWDICESYAEQRGFYVKRGRPDAYRAGNQILRDHLEGRVVMYFLPNSQEFNVTTERRDSSEEVDHQQNFETESEQSEQSETEESSSSSFDAGYSNPFDILGSM
eukprot:TRINITY_DN10664_c0_g1_i1.p1 TRINITY_DN10664_c0_g1~~TRINITY_DN10664_c0_g1_i1.p1  ORF type:complete len:612 (-),score=154.08 TRINITY_DN10664_c0_g1_i1:113-1948(-)